MKTIKILDLVQTAVPVEIDAETQIMIRPISLREMVSLMLDQSDNFLGLFTRGMEGNLTAESLGPFLIACPDLIAKIIATACNEPDAFKTIENNMAATVQLIALQAIWKVSVPDPKKAAELLYEVTALLQNLAKKGQEVRKNPLPMPLPQESLTQ